MRNASNKQVRATHSRKLHNQKEAHNDIGIKNGKGAHKQPALRDA